MLRNRLSDDIAVFPDPKRGINLRKSPEDLAPDEAYLMENMTYDAGLRSRTGSTLFSTPSLGAHVGVGGHLFVYGDNQRVRLVAGGTNIWSLSDAGVATTLTSTMSSAQPTHFITWPITERAYIANGMDTLRYYDGTTLSTISGTNVPASPTMVKAFADRLFAIQGAVVIASNPRLDTEWASTGSAWSAYRPFASGAYPVAIHLHSSTGELGDPQALLLIFQRHAVYGLRGTDFGTDVTGGSPPTGWDAELVLLDPRIGTSSPYSLITVPGLGTFWFTTDRNIAWLPFGSAQPRLIGDVLITDRSDVLGINQVDSVNLHRIVLTYHDRKLKLMLPEFGNTYTSTQYWLDLRPLYENLGAILRGDADEGEATAWSGPMVTQPISHVWVETESGVQERMFGLDGRGQSTGLYVYELNPIGVYTEAISTTSSNEIYGDYQTFFNTAGAPGYQKLMGRVEIDAGGYLHVASVSVHDLHATLTSPFTILSKGGNAFTLVTYGNGHRYGTGVVYGSTAQNRLGHVDFMERSTTVPVGDALQVQIQTMRRFVLRRLLGVMKVQRTLPVE